MKQLLLLLTVLLFSCSKEKIESTATDYNSQRFIAPSVPEYIRTVFKPYTFIIYKNEQTVRDSLPKRLIIDSLSFTVVFDSSALYQNGRFEDKPARFYGIEHSQGNLAYFGWQVVHNSLYLSPVVYRNGQLHYKPEYRIRLDIGVRYFFKIMLLKDKTVFWVNVINSDGSVSKWNAEMLEMPATTAYFKMIYPYKPFNGYVSNNITFTFLKR